VQIFTKVSKWLHNPEGDVASLKHIFEKFIIKYKFYKGKTQISVIPPPKPFYLSSAQLQLGDNNDKVERPTNNFCYYVLGMKFKTRT
jgi:hypothetical protein